jgi:hypothetical protein
MAKRYGAVRSLRARNVGTIKAKPFIYSQPPTEHSGVWVWVWVSGAAHTHSDLPSLGADVPAWQIVMHGTVADRMAVGTRLALFRFVYSLHTS